MEQITKNEMIEWIFDPRNKDLLQTLKLIKESSDGTDWYESLSDLKKNSIEKGISDHKSGKTLSSKEFWDKVR
jgi:hypothetical protein